MQRRNFAIGAVFGGLLGLLSPEIRAARRNERTVERARREYNQRLETERATLVEPDLSIRIGRHRYALAPDGVHWIEVESKAAVLGEAQRVKLPLTGEPEVWERPVLHEGGHRWRTLVEGFKPWQTDPQAQPLRYALWRKLGLGYLRRLAERIQALTRDPWSIPEEMLRSGVASLSGELVAEVREMENLCDDHHGPILLDQLHDVEVDGKTLRLCTYCRMQREEDART